MQPGPAGANIGAPRKTLKSGLLVRGYVVILVLGLVSSPAYVDPGILSTPYQPFYALAYGVLAAWIMRPWAWLNTKSR